MREESRERRKATTDGLFMFTENEGGLFQRKRMRGGTRGRKRDREGRVRYQRSEAESSQVRSCLCYQEDSSVQQRAASQKKSLK